MKFCTWDPKNHPHTFERVLVSVHLVWVHATATSEEEGSVSILAPGPSLPRRGWHMSMVTDHQILGTAKALF